MEALLIPILLFAFTSEAATGFGATVIALTLGSHLAPIRELVPFLVALDLPLVGWLAVRHRARIDHRLLWLRILPLMGAGAACGFALSDALGGATLRIAFGLLVVVLASRELTLLLGSDPEGRGRPLSPATSRAWIAVAGVIHGVYATGGPALVYALGRSPLSRASFRSTLASVWLVLNSALIVAFLIDGRLGGPELREVARSLPIVAVAIVLGEVVHARIDERRFRIAVFGLLVPAGLALLF